MPFYTSPTSLLALAAMCKCTVLSPTLGQLVSLAYDRNQALINQSDGPTIDADLVDMRKLMLHSTLWTKLQGTFFAPGADVQVLAALPALSAKERSALCSSRCPLQRADRERRPAAMQKPVSEQAGDNTPRLTIAAPILCLSDTQHVKWVTTSQPHGRHPLATSAKPTLITVAPHVRILASASKLYNSVWDLSIGNVVDSPPTNPAFGTILPCESGVMFPMLLTEVISSG
jgi:hypothetical protein